MEAQLISLFAETSIHPGAEGGSGFVDLPVAREAATDYPVIPGSSLKGALAGFARSHSMTQDLLDRVFGKADQAGAMLVSDARLLLLPVRSLHSAYKWITCPHLLERFQRDLHRAGFDSSLALPSLAELQPGCYLGPQVGDLFLEERQLKHQSTVPPQLLQALKPLIPFDHARSRLPDQLVVLHDDDFVWFARYGLAVQPRNVLDPERKTSQNLWYEEAIPPDSLFYALLARRSPDGIQPLLELLQKHPYLQVGANETTGMGWLRVTLLNSLSA